jgi:hypothetical protein
MTDTAERLAEIREEADDFKRCPSKDTLWLLDLIAELQDDLVDWQTSDGLAHARIAKLEAALRETAAEHWRAFSVLAASLDAIASWAHLPDRCMHCVQMGREASLALGTFRAKPSP